MHLCVVALCIAVCLNLEGPPPMKSISQSRRRTPWDDFNDRTETQSFIRDEFKHDYEEKHKPVGNPAEASLLNSIPVKCCRLCGSIRIKKDGYTANRIQRHFCNDCKSRFTVTTGTIFQDHKIPISEWIEYERNLFSYLSLTADSWNNKNAFTTSKYWFVKTCILISSCQLSTVLKGFVLLDETYLTVRSRDIALKDGKQYRGLSRNQICIGTAMDNQRVYLVILGTGKPSSDAIYEAFKEHIEPGSVLIHDNEKSHNKLISELDLESRSYDSNDLKTLPNSENPLYPINEKHNMLKKFLKAHSGFIRSDLQKYLDLFAFMDNPPYDKLEKIELLLTLALTNQVTLKYRDLFSSREDDQQDSSGDNEVIEFLNL